jgi:hypothetical protein
MPASKLSSRHTLKSDLARVDAHRIKKAEYEELPELIAEMLGDRSLESDRRRVANANR